MQQSGSCSQRRDADLLRSFDLEVPQFSCLDDAKLFAFAPKDPGLSSSMQSAADGQTSREIRRLQGLRNTARGETPVHPSPCPPDLGACGMTAALGGELGCGH